MLRLGNIRCILIAVIALSSCAKSVTDPIPELALLGLRFISYAYTGDTNGAYAFSYDPDTGTLTQMNSITGLNCSKTFVRHPSKSVAYCLGTVGGFDTIQVFFIDQSNLIRVQTITLGDSTYTEILPRPSGDYVVLGHGSILELVVYAVSQSNGTLSFAYATGANTGGAAMGFSHGGAYLYSRWSGNSLFEYAFSGTGVTQVGTPFNPGTNTWTFIESADSKYMFGSTNGNAFRFDIANGPATNFNGAATTATMPYATTLLNARSTSGSFFFYNQGAPNTGTLSYDSSTGSLTQISNLSGGLYGTNRVSPDGKFLYSTTATQYETYSIGSDGQLTRLTGSPVTTGFTGQQAFVFATFLKL